MYYKLSKNRGLLALASSACANAFCLRHKSQTLHFDHFRFVEYSNYSIKKMFTILVKYVNDARLNLITKTEFKGKNT